MLTVDILFDETSFAIKSLESPGEYAAEYVGADGSVLSRLPLPVRSPVLTLIPALATPTSSSSVVASALSPHIVFDPINVSFTCSSRHAVGDRLLLVARSAPLGQGRARKLPKNEAGGSVLFDGVDAPSVAGEYEVLYLHTAAGSSASGAGEDVIVLARSPIIHVRGPAISPQLAFPPGLVAGMYGERLLVHFETGAQHPPSDAVVLLRGEWRVPPSGVGDGSTAGLGGREVARLPLPPGVAQGILAFSDRAAPPSPGVYQLLYVSSGGKGGGGAPSTLAGAMLATVWGGGGGGSGVTVLSHSTPFFIAGPKVVPLSTFFAQYFPLRHAASAPHQSSPQLSPAVVAAAAATRLGESPAVGGGGGEGTRIPDGSSSSTSSGGGSTSLPTRVHSAPFRSPLLFAVWTSRARGKMDVLALARRGESPGKGSADRCVRFLVEGEFVSVIQPSTTTTTTTTTASSTASLYLHSGGQDGGGADGRLGDAARARLPPAAAFCGVILVVSFDASVAPRLPGIYAPVYVSPRPIGASFLSTLASLGGGSPFRGGGGGGGVSPPLAPPF